MSTVINPDMSNAPRTVVIAGSAPGTKGDTGVGIVNVSINPDGQLIFSKTDGTSVTVPLDVVVKFAAISAAQNIGASFEDIEKAVVSCSSAVDQTSSSQSSVQEMQNDVQQKASAVITAAQQVSADRTDTLQAAQSAAAITSGASEVLAQNTALASLVANNPAQFTNKGAWDASKNTPELTSGTGAEGDLYLVTVPGETSLDGVTDWELLDGAWFHNGVWNNLKKAGYPTTAETFQARKQIIADKITISSGTQKALAVKDPVGRILYALEHDGSIKTAGNKLTLGPVSFTCDQSDWLFKQQDGKGFIAWGVLSDGSPMFPSSARRAHLGPVALDYRTDGNFVVKNKAGFVIFNSDWVTPPVLTGDFTPDEIAERDRMQLARSAATMAGPGDMLRARPVWGISVSIATGQSEAMGFVSIPALSLTQPYDNITFGGDPRGFDFGIDGAEWTPRGGDPSPQPLVAVNVNQDTYATMDLPPSLVYKPSTVDVAVPTVASGNPQIQISTTDASIDFTTGFSVGQTIQCAGFTGAAAANNESGGWWYSNYITLTNVTAQSITGTCDYVWFKWIPVAVTGATGVSIAPLRITRDFGEQQSIAALNFFRGMQLAFRGLTADATRKLALLSCCVSGTSIEQLSKGATPDLFGRISQSAIIAKQQADKLNTTIGCFLLEFCQGGSNTNTDYATYYPLLAQYFEDVKTELKTQFGQTKDPFIEIVPISGENLPKTGIMDVCRAQVDYVKATPGAYIPTVGYPAIDYGPHYSSNGERYVGAMRAKVRHRVITQGMAWKPLIMEQATLRGKTILVDCHVPYPPMRVLDTWEGQHLNLRTDLGFGVYDTVTNAQLGVVSVSLAGETQVEIILSAEPENPVWVTYGDANHNGSGNIYDSDPAVSSDVYEWVEGNGAPYSENLINKIGLPYELFNPMINYAITATSED